MSIYGTRRNVDELAFDLTDEYVGGLYVQALVNQVVVVPPRSLHQWHVMELCTLGPDPDNPQRARAPHLRVRPKGSDPWPDVYAKPFSAWCTGYADTHLVQGIQHDKHIELNADYPYEEQWNTNNSTLGVFRKYAARGAWCPGFCDYTVLRLEVQRKAGTGDQICQFNVFCGNEIEEYSATNDGSMAFRNQVKGFGQANERQVSGNVTQFVPRGGNEGYLFLQLKAEYEGIFLTSGYGMRAAMAGTEPVNVPSLPPVIVTPGPDPVHAALVAAAPALRSLVAILDAQVPS